MGVALSLVLGIAVSTAFAGVSDRPPVSRGSWNRFSTPLLVTSQGGPVHHSNDILAFRGESVTLRGKFSYGKLAKDLEGESVSLWVRPEGKAGSWQKLGSAITDSDGAVYFRLPQRVLDASPRLEFEMVVAGDLSRATGLVRVIDAGRKAVVFDIDGTLTTSDREVFQDVLLGWTAQEHAGAADVTRRYAKAGFEIVYLTGRPYLIEQHSKDWLRDKGFAPGIVRTTSSVVDTTPTSWFVQQYKIEALEEFSQVYRLDFRAAYGNAKTDICAYAEAGLEIDTTFIIGPHAGKACSGYKATRALASFPSHTMELEAILRRR